MFYGCYRSVDGFLGSYFAKYGRFVARHPWKIIIISVLTNLFLGLGLLRLNIISDTVWLFTPLNNRASQELLVMEALFPDRSATNFYPHTMYSFEKFSEVIVRHKSNNNILTEKSLLQIEDFYKYILEKDMNYENGTTFRFKDICAKRDGECFTTGDAIFQTRIKAGLLEGEATYPLYSTVYLGGLLGSPTVVDNRVKEAKSTKFRFHARNDEGGDQWEQEFRKTMESYQSDEFDFAYAYSKALDDEVNATISGDTILLVFTILLMVSFASSVTMGGNCLSDRSHLGRLGVCTAAIGILGAFGLVCGAGMFFGSISSVAPFLVLGVGLDDMFILLSGLSDTYGHIRTVEDRIGETMRTSGMAITITSLTDLLAFSAGALSSFPAIQSFCTFAAVAIFLTYLMFVTFFLGCMTLYEQRVKSERHCCTCRKIKTKEEMKDNGISGFRLLCCSGSKPNSKDDVQNPIEKVVSNFFSRIVLYEPARFIVLLIFATYLGIGVWGSMYFDEGILLEQLTSVESPFYKHAVWNSELYANSDMTMNFVITKPVPYVNSSTMTEIDRLLEEAVKDDAIPDDFILSWYEAYKGSSYFDDSSEAAFAQNLKLFVEAHPLFLNDVGFSIDGKTVMGSRVYYRTHGVNDIMDFREVMVSLRKLADESPLPVIAYSPVFIYLEQVVAIVPQTIQNLSIALGSIMLVTIFMIPHPAMVLLITFSVASILVGLIGFMHLWGLMLSSITMVELIMCIGFSIDYSSHIVHAYMQADGDTRSEKVKSAMRLVGGPIFSGVFSTFVGVIMLLFANSFIYISFFKVISLVLSLGLLHALLVIPVILTFIGPLQAEGATGNLKNPYNIKDIIKKMSTSDSEFSQESLPTSISDSSGSNITPYVIPRPRFKHDTSTEKGDNYSYTNDEMNRVDEFIYTYH